MIIISKNKYDSLNNLNYILFFNINFVFKI